MKKTIFLHAENPLSARLFYCLNWIVFHFIPHTDINIYIYIWKWALFFVHKCLYFTPFPYSLIRFSVVHGKPGISACAEQPVLWHAPDHISSKAFNALYSRHAMMAGQGECDCSASNLKVDPQRHSNGKSFTVDDILGDSVGKSVDSCSSPRVNIHRTWSVSTSPSIPTQNAAQTVVPQLPAWIYATRYSRQGLPPGK